MTLCIKNNLYDSRSEIPPSTCQIQKLYPDLWRTICNYIGLQETVTTTHLVCKAWHQLLPNDGALDLHRYKIRGQNLSRLIEKYITGAKLSSLNLSNCKYIGDQELAYLGNFPKTRLNLNLQEKYQKTLALKELDISECPITDGGLQYLRNLSLTDLDLSRCIKITDAGLEILPKTSLERLSLKATSITDRTLKSLASCRSLTSLDLTFCHKITDIGLQALALCPLQKLVLVNCKLLTDTGIFHLAGKTSLTDLNLYECSKITDASLQILAHLPLRVLNLVNTKISDRGLRDLAQCTTLEKLSLDLCNISDEGLRTIAHLPLKSINLCASEMNQQITDKGLTYLAQVTSLTRIYLTALPKITDVGLKKIINLQLVELFLICIPFTEKGFASLFEHNSSLTYLHLEEVNVTDNNLQGIAHLPLRTLDLTCCEKVSSEGLKCLISLPLEFLNLTNCSEITNEDQTRIEAMFPDTQITIEDES